MFFLLELHCTEYKTVLCLKRERRGNLNLSDLTQGWRLKSLIKPGSYLAPRFWGGGGGKETMTFQTTSHNHVGTFSSLSLQGGSCWVCGQGHSQLFN